MHHRSCLCLCLLVFLAVQVVLKCRILADACLAHIMADTAQAPHVLMDRIHLGPERGVLTC